MFWTPVDPASLLSADLMSAKPAPSPVTPVNPPGEGTPREQRIPNPRPKKPAKVAIAPAGMPLASDAEPPMAEPEVPEIPASSSLRGDWPEPEPASAGASGVAENPKRKRRRKKGKGHNPQTAEATGDDESSPQEIGEPAVPSVPQPMPSPGPPPRPVLAPRARIDPDVLAKLAWKIYLAEISEEGVALVGDIDAKELSRRCFRLAEIFIEEQSRRR